MLFHIEGNSKWAHKFNSKIMKCHEMMEESKRCNINDVEINDDISSPS